MEAVPPVNTLERRGSSTHCLLRSVYIMTVVALIIQFIAMVTPWWMVVSFPDLKMSANIGLFFVIGCYYGECKSISTDKLEDNYSDAYDDILLEGAIETINGILSGVIAFGLLMVIVRQNPLDTRITNVAAVATMLLISGVLMLVAGGRFINETSIVSEMLSIGHESNHFGVPSSAVLACVGGSLACIASFMYIMAVAYQRNNQPNVYQEFNPGQLQPGVVMTAPAPPGYPIPMMPPQGFPQPAGNVAAPVQTGMLPDPRASGYGYDQPK